MISKRVAGWCSLILLIVAFPLLLHADGGGKPDALTVDGGEYFGSLVNGRLHGKGLIKWPNGDYYQGAFLNGRFSGTGKLVLAGGESYEGEFRDGRKSGRGRLVTADGSVFVGVFVHDRLNGHGRYQGANGETYDGEFRDGAFHGNGEFKHGGRSYSGRFQHGSFHGKGRYDNGRGEIYEGDFVKGDLHGNGIYTHSEGVRYEGEFRDWVMHGSGRYADPGGNIYEGRFVDGQLQGEGTFTGADGTRYEGGFREWMFAGKGKLYSANGDVYVGSFENGRYHGQGVLTYGRAREDGRTQDIGEWRYGALAGSNEQGRFADVAESAIYSQRRLLDEALAALQPGDPGKIELYLLAIGGDGSQEVFRREVEFVSQQFAQRFGTNGRTVTLINSRTTAATQPMATVTSVRESLQAISRKMNRDQDVLFLFMTSHGSEDHEFVIDQNGMNLHGLPATQLAELLNASGIRWKVVLISTCYSGGFINPLKDGRTLIIAAARRDRTSFGCADENDFTYFGRAYFKDALPKSDSFQDAFYKAKKIVRERELAESKTGRGRVEYSFPQMENPHLIEEYLRRWWKTAVASRR